MVSSSVPYGRQPPRLALLWPILAIVALVVAQYALALASRDLWYADEVRQAAVWRHIIDTGNFLAPRLNGEPYLDKPPLYFLFIAGLGRLYGSTEPSVLFFGVMLTVAFHHVAVFGAALALGGRRREALLAAVIAATASYPLLLGHYARMDFMFAGLIILATAAFYLAVRETNRPWWMLTGYVLSAAAVLTKGPLGLALPLAALGVFLALRGRLRRFLKWDVLAGLAVLAVVIGGWLYAVWLAEGTGHLEQIFRHQLIGRALGANGDGDMASYGRYLLTLPVAFLPWTPVLLTPTGQRHETESGESTRVSPGVTYALGAVVSGFVLLSLIREKHEYFLLPLLGPLAFVAAVRLSAASARDLAKAWLAVSCCFVLLFAFSLALPSINPLPVYPTGWAAAAALLAGLAVAVFVLRHRGLMQPMALVVIGQTLWINILTVSMAPSLDEIMSPRAVAATMATLADRGYALAAVGTTPGVLAYHLKRPYSYPRTRDEFERFLTRNPRAAVAVPRRYRERNIDTFAGLAVEAEIPMAAYRIIILRQDREE